jgi:rsbT antagonist protein RsbS
MDRISILKMGEFLLVTIQVDMHDQLASALQDDLTNKIAKANAKAVLIDISSLDIVDSFIGGCLPTSLQWREYWTLRQWSLGCNPRSQLHWLSSGSTAQLEWGAHSARCGKRDGDVALPHWHPRPGRGYRCSRPRRFRLPLPEISSRCAMQSAAKR